MLAADRSTRITAVNVAACRLFGWPARQLIGKPLSVLMPTHFPSTEHLLRKQASTSLLESKTEHGCAG